MAVVASVDGPNRRIYLSATTVGVEVQPMDIYTEVRALRKADENLRKFDMFLVGLGRILKIPGKYTERFVQLLTDDDYGITTKVIPYDTGIGTSYTLDIPGTIITDQGQEGLDCFDTDVLDCKCNVYYHPPQVEILETGVSGLTGPESAAILNIDANVSLIQADIGTIEGSIGIIQTDITSLQGDVASINTDIGAINVDITAIKDDIISINTSIGDIALDISQIQVDLAFIKAIESGKWIIENNQMIFYDTNDQEIARFNLYNVIGIPSNDDVYRREPV